MDKSKKNMLQIRLCVTSYEEWGTVAAKLGWVDSTSYETMNLHTHLLYVVKISGKSVDFYLLVGTHVNNNQSNRGTLHHYCLLGINAYWCHYVISNSKLTQHNDMFQIGISVWRNLDKNIYHESICWISIVTDIWLVPGKDYCTGLTRQETVNEETPHQWPFKCNHNLPEVDMQTVE